MTRSAAAIAHHANIQLYSDFIWKVIGLSTYAQGRGLTQ